MNSTEEFKKIRKETANHLYDWYLKNYEKFSKAIYEQENIIDKTILTISTGAIFLTITFYSNIVGDAEQCLALFLKISWIFFLLSIIAVITSQRIAVSIFTEGRGKLQQWYDKSLEELDRGKADFPDLSSPLSKTNIFLNWFAFFSMIIGIFLAITFALLAF